MGAPSFYYRHQSKKDHAVLLCTFTLMKLFPLDLMYLFPVPVIMVFIHNFFKTFIWRMFLKWNHLEKIGKKPIVVNFGRGNLIDDMINPINLGTFEVNESFYYFIISFWFITKTNKNLKTNLHLKSPPAVLFIALRQQCF